MEFQTGSVLTYLATGAIASFVASGMFLAFLRAIRPRIEICPWIERSAGRGGQSEYSIKVVNKSWFRLIDIDARLDLVRRLPLPPEGRPLLKVTNIPLRTPHLFDLARYWRWDPEGKYAVRFGVEGNLEDHWLADELAAEADTFLLFRVAATHSLSGFRRVVEKRFTRGAIKDGVFHFGRSCDVGV